MQHEAVEDWPLLPEHERPLASRLAQLIAHAPTIDVSEANDRRALLQHRRAAADAEREDEKTAEGVGLTVPAASPSQSGQRKRRVAEREGTSAAEVFVPTFRGGGEGEGGDDDDVDEERLSRVQPDPLYDPHMDDADQQRLQAAHSQPAQPALPPLRPLLSTVPHADPSPPPLCPLRVALPPPGRSSDAVLSCPCCFTTLCLDCQRHTDIPSQYRAMFVQHCRALTDRPVQPRRAPTSSGSRKRRGRRRQRRDEENKQEEEEEGEGREEAEGSGVEGSGVDAAEWFFPVVCEECSTEVGVVDTDEIYHFNHVLDT